MENVEQNGRIVWQKGNHSQHKYFQSFIKFKFNTSCLYFMQSRNRRLSGYEKLVGHQIDHLAINETNYFMY